ncbi:MAG TPA: nitroreductase [Actinoplanes sp.]|nr:nitroreductase [Actinoplanes sp.]
MHAPSVFNTQPWRWRVVDETLELLPEADRRLPVIDPDGRLMMLSCGAALHHARIALAAAGWRTEVDRDADSTGPIARIHLAGQADPDQWTQRLFAAITQRRTDRRSFGERQVAPEILDTLRSVVEAEDSYLHYVRRDQMPLLATSTARAAADELDDPAYRAELQAWTNRKAGSGDGVPVTTAVRPAPRRVPIRNYAPGGSAGLPAGDGFDIGASFAILFGATDDPPGWLRGGEALSALLLTATADGLATAPLSDAIELEWPRQLMHDLLAEVGAPYLVIRLGYSDSTEELPPAPRRAAADVIECSE